MPELSRCPECGTMTVEDGVCKSCGYKVPGKEKPEVTE